MTVAISFGQWLKQRRKAHDLTQEELAEQVGCSPETIRKIEAGARRPSREIAGRMALFLKLTPEEQADFVLSARTGPCPELPIVQRPAGIRVLAPPDTWSAPGREALAEAPPPAAPPPPPAPLTYALPAYPTSLIGRKRLIATAETLLRRDDVRLLTLSGPGGTGKTRLGVQVAFNLAGAFADGVCFVALAAIRDPEQVIQAIAQALAIKEEGGRPVLDSLRAALRERHMLLVLDNFEQVLDGAPNIAMLLAACPRLKVLVTSRVVLRLYGEYELTIPPLELPERTRVDSADLAPILLEYEAIRLFVTRAEAIRPQLSPREEELLVIAEICERLDGLPLAIELAAARSKFFTPQALLAQMSSRLNLLTGGSCDLPARQRTLRDTIAWSFRLLDAEERRVFVQLGVFVGSFSAEAAEAVCAAEDVSVRDEGSVTHDPSAAPHLPILTILAALVDKSLLRQDTDEDGNPRFTMLETIREYALEQLAACSEVEPLCQRHAAYYLALVEAAGPRLWSAQRVETMRGLEREYANIRAALAWSQGPSGHAETALRMAGALWWFWFMRSWMSEGRLWLTGALERRDGTSAAAQAMALPRAGIQAWFVSDYERAQALCAEGLALNRQLADDVGVAFALHGLGLVAQDRGEPRAAAYFEESLAIFRRLHHIWGIAWSLFRLGQSGWLMLPQESALAVQWLEESLELFRRVGDHVGVAHALYSLGAVSGAQGDLARARQRYEEGLELCRAYGDKGTMIYALHGLGQLAQRQGDLGQATALYAESLALCRELREQRGFAMGLEGLAAVAEAEGRLERAVKLCGVAAAWRDQISFPLPPLERPNYERTLASARSRLSEWAFATSWDAGQGMTIEQGLACALQS
jgi:predicted ATPase/transcriptional regulator with XRE-family HTH domain